MRIAKLFFGKMLLVCIVAIGCCWCAYLLSRSGQDGGSPIANVPSDMEELLNDARPLQFALTLGGVPQGGRVEKEVWILNSNNREIFFERIDSSCECLELSPATANFGPNQTLRMKLVLDLRREPKFTGNLRIEASGLDRASHVVLGITVDASVVAVPAQ